MTRSMSPETLNRLINAILFQACWFLAILLGWQWAVVPLAMLLVHGVMCFLSIEMMGRLVAVAVMGIALDSLWMNLHLYRFPTESTTLIPLWLMTLWFGFALTLPSSLVWLLSRPSWFVPVCALMGPLSYAAGRRLGALDFDEPVLLLLALQWAGLAALATLILKKSNSPLMLSSGKSCA